MMIANTKYGPVQASYEFMDAAGFLETADDVKKVSRKRLSGLTVNIDDENEEPTGHSRVLGVPSAMDFANRKAAEEEASRPKPEPMHAGNPQPNANAKRHTRVLPRPTMNFKK